MTEIEDLKEIKLLRKASEKDSRQYNIGYLLGFIATLSIGSIQFGYSLGYWNTITNIYALADDWGDKKTTR